MIKVFVFLFFFSAPFRLLVNMQCNTERPLFVLTPRSLRRLTLACGVFFFVARQALLDVASRPVSPPLLASRNPKPPSATWDRSGGVGPAAESTFLWESQHFQKNDLAVKIQNRAVVTSDAACGSTPVFVMEIITRHCCKTRLGIIPRDFLFIYIFTYLFI